MLTGRPTSPWRVLIAEDHAMLRSGLTALLAATQEFDVIGEVDNGQDAIRSVVTLKPDVILMDLTMPLTNGTEATARIKRRNPEIKIVILSIHKAEEYIHAAFVAGADGYLLKDDSKADLLQALRMTLSGKSYLSPLICEKVVDGFLGGLTHPAKMHSWDILTKRQKEILKLVAEGHRNKEIANVLSISIKTVEKHRSNVMKRLNLQNVSAVTAYAIENGLVS